MTSCTAWRRLDVAANAASGEVLNRDADCSRVLQSVSELRGLFQNQTNFRLNGRSMLQGSARR